MGYNRKKKEADLLFENETKNRYKCRCGYSVVIYPFEKRDSKICVNCGYKIYNDAEKQKQYDFKVEMQKRLKRSKDDR